MVHFSTNMAKVLACILLLISQACATVQDKQLVENGLTLRYLPASDIEKIHLQHPIPITEAEVRKALQSFWYEETSLLEKKNPVFTESEASKISRLLTKALNHAKPGKIVQFELATATGKTEVDVFADDKGRIHWRFQSIKGMNFTCNQADCPRINWRIILKDGQRYYPARTDLFTRPSAENWIMKKLPLPE